LQRLTPADAQQSAGRARAGWSFSGTEIPGTGEVMETLRAEFRGNGQPQKRNQHSGAALLQSAGAVAGDGAAQHATDRRHPARIFGIGNLGMDHARFAADDGARLREDVTDLSGWTSSGKLGRSAATFQTKVGKSMERTF